LRSSVSFLEVGSQAVESQQQVNSFGEEEENQMDIEDDDDIP